MTTTMSNKTFTNKDVYVARVTRQAITESQYGDNALQLELSFELTGRLTNPHEPASRVEPVEDGLPTSFRTWLSFEPGERMTRTIADLKGLGYAIDPAGDLGAQIYRLDPSSPNPFLLEGKDIHVVAWVRDDGSGGQKTKFFVKVFQPRVPADLKKIRQWVKDNAASIRDNMGDGG